ncbi:MAG TPA: glycosyltransferase family 4 protein [Phnomibacter sp.]|nr:glycosyltransferase family 4 protein [Phnomibacter sp.]
MHICFLGEIATATITTGGIGSFVANIIPELLQQGCTISVISYKKQAKPVEIENVAGYSIHWINTHQWGRLRFYKKMVDTNRVLKSIHRKQPIQIIDSPEAGFFMLHKISCVKYVARLHGGHIFFAHSTTDTPFSRKKAWIERRSLQKADAIIGVSKYVLATTAATYPFILMVPHEIIYNPIILDRFYATDPAKVVSGNLLFLGSLTEKKGIRQLIEALPIVLAKFPHVQLHVYGRDVAIRPSGKSFKALLEALIEQKHLVSSITLHPPLPNYEIPSVIESAEIVVLPSHMESQGLAFIEAMAMEKPLIAGSPGPVPEIITHHSNGLLCNPFDPTDIAEKICYMLSHKEKAIAMGEQARRDIKLGFGSQLLASRNIQFYYNLLK